MRPPTHTALPNHDTLDQKPTAAFEHLLVPTLAGEATNLARRVHSLTSGRRLQNYSAWFPTARNTNKNNIAAAGADLLLASYAARPSDCRYSNQAIVSTASGAARWGPPLSKPLPPPLLLSA